jgi:ankyrin repeat protein
MKLLQVKVPPVFVAIQNENVQELERILKEDASVVQSRHDSLTPLLYVVDMLVKDSGDRHDVCYEMMRLLLQHGKADPNVTPTANRNGHLNVQQDPGDTALHRICVALKEDLYQGNNGDFKKSAALLLYEYNAIVPPATEQLLHDAARRNQLEFCHFLIKDLKISPNVKGRQGMTPLQFAARSGKTEMVVFFLSQEGIDVDIQDDRGQTALDAARVNDKEDIVVLLERYREEKASHG